jgi:hypothetical protein
VSDNNGPPEIYAVWLVAMCALAFVLMAVAHMMAHSSG